MGNRRDARELDPRSFTEGDRRRFWTKVAVGSAAECWTWTAYRTPLGYGRFGWRGYVHSAHRWSYALHSKAEVPVGLVIDHLCRNPSCVNPAHLEAVSHEENISRGIPAKSRTTHCPQGHEYTPENTTRYRATSDGRWRRECRTCSREKQRKAAATPEFKAAAREYRTRTREQRREYEQTLLETRRAKWAESAAKMSDKERASRNARARELYHARQSAKRDGEKR